MRVAAVGDNLRMSEDTTQHLPHNGFERILARLDSIDTRLSTFDGHLASVEGQLKSLEGRLASLEDKVERRLQDTRPIWEQVLARLDGVENQMGSLATRMEGMEGEMRNGFRRLERQMGLLAEDVMIVRADQRDLEKRMSQLEPKPTP